MNRRTLVLPLTVLILLSGCVRYIESRKEISKKFEMDPAAKRAGMEGFYRYEQEQRKRLELLIEKRQALSKLDTNNDYKIGPSDEIKLTVKDFESVNKSYNVSADGKIKIPFVGNVKLAGLSETQAAEKISKLVTEFVVEPMVDVEVTKYSSNLVWVLDNSSRNRTGTETSSQNSYPIKRKNYTLMDLLLELQNTSYFDSGVIYLYPAAGGNADNVEDKKNAADKKQSLIDRFNALNTNNWAPDAKSDDDCTGAEYKDGGPLRVKACYPYENKVTEAEINAKYDDGSRIDIDVEELFGGVTKKPLNIILQPGDLIHVAPPPIVQIYGEVQNSGTFMASQGGGLIGGNNLIKPSLLSAITAARGLTYAADIGNVEIYREIQFANKAILGLDLEKVVFLAGQDVRLRDGDIILVPSKHGRFYESTIINAINSFAGSVTNIDNTNNVFTN